MKKVLLGCMILLCLGGCAAHAAEQKLPPDTVENQKQDLGNKDTEKTGQTTDKSDVTEDSKTANPPAKGVETPKQKPAAKPTDVTAPPAAQPKKSVCTISATCATVQDNLDALDESKADIVPENGVILSLTEIELKEGDSAFDILQQAAKDGDIQLEFVKTPAYKSAYIEGLGNLYEFDCGPLSGWMYRVNGQFPGYGCSSYTVKSGDQIEFVYTCDLGADIGGDWEAQRQ